MTQTIRLRVNGAVREVGVADDELLCDMLRQRLDLTGTKVACREGVCGSCDVLYDGAVVRSCLVLACQADAASVVTVEGLAEDGCLSPLQQAFVETGAVQCGFCTPGMLIAATAALCEASADWDDHEFAEAIAGNLCRCTGYAKIIDAIRQVVATGGTR
jgi:carbon-monoxide dehydrogenase small subunit